MSQQPSIRLQAVSVEVPISLPASKRKRSEHPCIALEIWTDCFRVWDEATYSLCGVTFSFAEPQHQFERAPREITKIPHFEEVYRYLVDQYTANRGNPLGKFLAPAIAAMDHALCERDGTSVYFAQAAGRIKIGWSRNVSARVAQLQTGNSEPVRLLATTPGARSLERRLHEQFAEARVAGEWFEATPDLVAYIGELSGASSA